MHHAQIAEDIDTISFAYDSPMSLPDHVKIGLHQSTFSSRNFTPSDPLVLI